MNETQIARLSARGSEKDQLALSMKLSSLIENTSFKPSSMPPSAILIVRKMGDPLPSKLTADAHQFVPDAQWQIALNQQLNNVYFNAMRPHNGVIAKRAEAVVFSDMSELLACYIHDLVNARAWQCWCWKTLLKTQSAGTHISTILRNTFVEHIEYLPAVLEKLSLWQVIQPVLGLLDKKDALTLSQCLIDEYGLSDLSSTLKNADIFYEKISENIKDTGHKVSNSSLDNRGKNIDKKHEPMTGQKSDQYTHNGISFQLQRFFSEQLSADVIPADLSVTHVLLMGCGLVLHHRSWHAKSHFFQKKLIEILTVSDSHGNDYREVDKPARLNDLQPSGEKKTDSTERINRDVSVMNESADKRLDHESDAVERVINNAEFTVLSEEHDQQNIYRKNQQRNNFQNKSIDNVSGEFLKHKNSELKNEVPDKKTENQNNEINKNLNTDSQKTDFAGDVISTDLGGILYLLNLLVWLDLSDCLENKLHLSKKISPWGLLEIISKKLLAENIADYKEDAIWGLLRELDGHDADKAIDTGVMETYRLPERWFKAVYTEGEIFYWFSDKSHLCLWAASGYVIADVKRNKETDFIQAENILSQYTERSYKVLLLKSKAYIFAPEKKKIEDTLPGQWINYLMTYIQYRLMLACDMPCDIHGQDLFLSLLKCRGRIHVSSCHIDFIAPVENISMPARRAGLDRDPSWIAEAARVILFHFNASIN